jgi:hypothetical protein
MPRAAGAGKQRAHLVIFPSLGPPPRSSAWTYRLALQPAAKPRRDLVATSAAKHLAQERVKALPLAAAGVVSVLDLAPQRPSLDVHRLVRQRGSAARPASAWP